MAKKKVEAEAPAVREEKSVGAANSALDMMYEQAGSGQTNVRADDQSIPFLGIVQSNSPQRKKNSGKYIDGIEEGHIFNTVTGQNYGENVTVVPVGYERIWTEWVPRDAGEGGGGFRGRHDRDSGIDTGAFIDDKGRRILENGNEIVDTAMHYVLVVGENGFERAVISMTSTQLKKSKKWNTLIGEKRLKNRAGHLFTPPSYAFKYELGSVEESNAQGSWMGWTITDAGQLIDLNTPLEEQPEALSLFEFAGAFCKDVGAGDIKVSSPEPMDVEATVSEHDTY